MSNLHNIESYNGLRYLNSHTDTLLPSQEPRLNMKVVQIVEVGEKTSTITTVGEAISCVGFWGPDQHDLQKPTSATRRGPRCGCVAQLGHCQQSLAAKP